jgi:hypothetical protein
LGKAKSEGSEKLGRLLAASGYVRVRLEKNRLGLLEVRVRINGIAARLIVDTGAANTILAREGAERFCALEPSDDTAAGVESGPQTFATGTIDKITIGRVMFHHVRFLAIPLDHINDTLEAQGGLRVDGLVGADLLVRRNAVIDYRDAVLYLESRTVAVKRVRENGNGSSASKR